MSEPDWVKLPDRWICRSRRAELVAGSVLATGPTVMPSLLLLLAAGLFVFGLLVWIALNLFRR